MGEWLLVFLMKLGTIRVREINYKYNVLLIGKKLIIAPYKNIYSQKKAGKIADLSFKYLPKIS